MFNTVSARPAAAENGVRVEQIAASVVLHA
jgi:hypothetical protein